MGSPATVMVTLGFSALMEVARGRSPGPHQSSASRLRRVVSVV